MFASDSSRLHEGVAGPGGPTRPLQSWKSIRCVLWFGYASVSSDLLLVRKSSDVGWSGPRGPYTSIFTYIVCHVLPMLAMFCHVLPCFWTVLIPRPHACSAPRSRQTKAPLACRLREGSCACFLIYRLLATFGWPAHTHTQWFTMVCIYARIISTCYSMWLIP